MSLRPVFRARPAVLRLTTGSETMKRMEDAVSTRSVHTDRGTLRVVTEHFGLADELAADLYTVMRRAYAPLATETAFQHSYSYEDWLSLMADERVYVAVAWVDGVPVGFNSFTTAHELVSLLHPKFFEARFGGRPVVYSIDIVIDPEFRGAVVARDLMLTSTEYVRSQGGTVVFYTAQCNVERRFVDLLSRTLRDDLAGPITPIDAVTFYSFDLTADSPRGVEFDESTVIRRR